MEPQKDNKIQPVSKETSVDFDKNIDHISFFEKNDYFYFVCKKTEKLATACYLVTGLFSDSEPMKWSLRKKVSELLSFILGYKNSILSKNAFLASAKEKVLDVVSSLQVSSGSGLVSVMNFSILQREFLNLVKVLDEPKIINENSPEMTLSKSFFEIPRNAATSLSDGEQLDGTSLSAARIKDKAYENDYRSVPKRTNRQSVIIGLLKKKKEMSIKDITQIIRDCSEKTIQRELASLIQSGVVKKTGERRWSKYSLAV